MATVTGMTAERMLEIEDASIVDGSVVDGDLILTTHGGTPINAGSVIGPTGPSGPTFVVCTNATQPTYTAQEEGKAIFETDTNLTRIWMGTYFKVQEQIVCTSATRPSTLLTTDAGTKIFESDTGLEYWWTGTSFMPAGSWTARFADVSARASGWADPPDGALSYLDNFPGVLWTFDNGNWVSVGDPVGTYKPAFTTDVPLCHVLMYGQSLANADVNYPVLWSKINAAFKSGSSINVPDMRGRVPVGLDNMGGVDAGRLSVTNTIGATGGAQTHTLSASEMPVHNHSYVSTPGSNTVTDAYSSGNNAFLQTGTLNNTTGNAGSGAAHNNMQPYILTNWVLKVA